MSGFFYTFTVMKAKEFIYNLRTNFTSVKSQITEATDQHVLFMLDEARAILAAQKMDNRINVELMSQHIDVKPVIADSRIYGDVGETEVMVVSIPPVINYNNGAGIFTVGTQDGVESFTRISFSQIRTALSRKYTSLSPKWFYLEGKIYIINIPIESSSKVRVRGIFDNPVEIIKLKGEYKVLDPFNWDYPLSVKDAKTVYQIAMSGDLGWGDNAVGAVNKAKEEADEKAARKRKK